ncbi:MAG: NAD(P)-dependent alcohol dehydrogenase [Candidatus Thorarchaeota archaeon]|jgi:NADPH:quinone reductase-like Zn-dependent oxidoreductase
MKAAIYEKYGPPEVLQIQEMEKPSPKENEVLIKIHATTVCAADWRFRKPSPYMVKMMNGFRTPKTKILGLELAGEIEAIGSDVTRFKLGDQIFGTTGWTFGAYSEYICLPEDASITTKPSNLSLEEAAVVPVGADTARYYMIERGNVQSGQKVLIYGASSSVGSYAVPLAKHLGAEVTAVCSSRNFDWVKDLGADKMIDYTKEDVTKSGETYDAIFDVVGKLSIRKSMKILKDDGVFLDCVGMMRRGIQAKIATMRSNKRVMGDSAEGKLEDLIYIKELVEAGVLKPVIDRRYPLEEIAEAHRYVETGRKKGNVVITITHSS